jgi:hypothetical protein
MYHSGILQQQISITSGRPLDSGAQVGHGLLALELE